MKRIVFITFITFVILCLYHQTTSAMPIGTVAQLGKGGIEEIAFSPDGSMLAVATSIGVYLYDVTAISEIAFFETGLEISSISFSPDGDLLAGVSFSSIILWDIKTYKEIYRSDITQKYYFGLSSVAFSPDGNLLACGGGSKIGRIFVSASISGGVTLWDVKNRREVFIFTGKGVASVAFSPDGTLLAAGEISTVGRPGSVRLWNMKTYKEVPSPIMYDVSSVAFSPDGQLLASGGAVGGIVKLWDIQNSKEVTTFSGHSSGITSVTFSPDGRLLASGSWDKTVKIWDVQSHNELATLSGHSCPVYSIVFNYNNGNLLASGGEDGIVKIWDIQSKKELAALSGYLVNIADIAFSPDGLLLASGSWDNNVKLWNMQSYEELVTLSGHTNWVTSVTFSPDGRLLASGSWDKTVKLWDNQNYKEITMFNRHSSNAQSVAFSPDGFLLASGSADETVKLWDVQKHEELFTFLGHKDRVTSVTFSSDGKLLASGSYDTTIKLWDIREQKEMATFVGHTDMLASVTFGPDNRLLASGGRDRTVKLWDIQNQKEIATLKGHADWVTSVAFSRNGRLLASGSRDGTVKLWDIQNQKEIATLKGHADWVNSVAFSPNKCLLASASEDGTILLWNMTPYMPNQPPILSDIPDQAINEGGTFPAIKLDDYVSDPDNTDAEMKWTVTGNTKLTVVIDNDRVAVITALDPEWDGNETLNFTAEDPGGLKASDTAKFTVNPVNDPPVITDIPDQTIEEGGAFVIIKLDEFVSDPDNGDTEIVWTFAGNTDLAVDIDDARVATVAVSDPEWNGSETITFTAKDPGGLGASDSAKFTVTPVDAPIRNDDKQAVDPESKYPAKWSEIKNTKLLQNYPNPFNPDTWIPYALDGDTPVSIQIYSATGQLVRALDLGLKSVGVYISKDRAAYWDGCDDAGQPVASGMYFYTLKAGLFQATGKMAVVR